MSSSPERSFFKVILSPTLRFNKLRIPKDFASKYYKELSAYCCLEVPTGVAQSHRVELDKEDDELWFGNGLEEFINAFSIRYGYFLLFIYQGVSKFRVHIYDLTACEISYERRSHDGSSLGSCEQFESETDVSVSSPDLDLQFYTFPYSKFPWLCTCGEIVRALADAGIPVPDNPFFVTAIQKCNLDRFTLTIPASFAQEHLRCESGFRQSESR